MLATAPCCMLAATAYGSPPPAQCRHTAQASASDMLQCLQCLQCCRLSLDSSTGLHHRCGFYFSTVTTHSVMCEDPRPPHRAQSSTAPAAVPV